METVIIVILPILLTVGLGWFFYWRTNKALLAIFWLVSSLPGGDVATRIYEDMRKSGQVRGVPCQKKDGKWAISWKLPAYKEKTPKL